MHKTTANSLEGV